MKRWIHRMMIPVLMCTFASAGFSTKVFASAASELAKENRARKAKEEKSKRKKTLNSKASYLLFKPEFYTQYQKSKSHMGYLSVEIHFKLQSEDDVGQVNEHAPLIQSSFLQLIANQPRGALRTLRGREILRGQAKKTIRKVMKKATGDPIISEVYFTKYLAD